MCNNLETYCYFLILEEVLFCLVIKNRILQNFKKFPVDIAILEVLMAILGETRGVIGIILLPRVASKPLLE